ncbi:hypothetical protein ACHAXS_003875 [Conticribra weissflogii]
MIFLSQNRKMKASYHKISMPRLLIASILCCGTWGGQKSTATVLSSPLMSFISSSPSIVYPASNNILDHSSTHVLRRCKIPDSNRSSRVPWSYFMTFTPSETNSIENKRALARQLLQENAMHSKDELEYANDTHNTSKQSQGPLDHYDVNAMTPMESEFHSLMSTFLTYSQRDIQSLTTTSSRYYMYAQNDQEQHYKKPRTRTKEEAIRYRVLFEGVQSGAMVPAVSRSFSVLFEDYLPIRIAGRKIYGFLNKVMEEVREERLGEVIRARDVTGWDWSVKEYLSMESRGVDTEPQNVIEYARSAWDTVMDRALLLDHSLEFDGNDLGYQEVGVISFSQMKELNIDRAMMGAFLIDSNEELESIMKDVAVEETHNSRTPEDGSHREITFLSFVRLLQRCSMDMPDYQERVTIFLERVMSDQQSRSCASADVHEATTMLAAKAVNSGSTDTCKKRQKNSERFDEYVSTFKVWEKKFFSDERQPLKELKSNVDSRRLDILRGCFEGARNERVVAALKIVYMDYKALRLAGDLIFKLMSKIVK